jgi:hypothetical protein
MARLREQLALAQPAMDFAAEKGGPATIARRLGLDSDFSGCYVLVDSGRPIYVGISRKVLSRLRQHLRGKTHFDASLVYAVAQRRHPTAGHRSSVMASLEFQKAFADAQSYLRSLHVAFVQIDNPLELYLFEAYAAMALGTHEWNTFRTH